MYDVCTHIGRPLVSEKPTSDFWDPQVGYYGSFPTNLLSEEYQDILEAHKRIGELDQLLKSSKNGFAKYTKLKRAASKHGSVVAKENVKKIKDHPIFARDPKTAVAVEQSAILDDIKNYKPKQSKKMAFVNPFSMDIERMKEHAILHKPKVEEEKVETINKLPTEQNKEKVEKTPIIKEKKKQDKPKKVKEKKTDFRDPVNFISLEPVTSPEKLKQVNL